MFQMLRIILLAIAAISALAGCSGSGSGGTATGKTISGTVADLTTGKPAPNVAITAYAISSAGEITTTALSKTVHSDSHGQYSLAIPDTYSGALVIEGVLQGAAKTVSAMSPLHVRAAVPPLTEQQTSVMLNLATELAVRYVELNHASSFTPETLRLATLMLEPLFGIGFGQVPASDGPTRGGEQLLIIGDALQLMTDAGHDLTDLLTLDPDTGLLTALTSPAREELAALAETARGNLINTGTIAAATAVPELVGVSENSIDLGDPTPPATPGGLTATATSGSVQLSWAPGDAAAYLLSRDGALIATTTEQGFTDSWAAPTTTYNYEVRARDAAGNVSPPATLTVTTPALETYTISGRVTQQGAGVAQVTLIITGTGTGVTMTDDNGYYTFFGAKEGGYVVMPVPTSHSFTPVSRQVFITGAPATNVNFEAQSGGTVTGGVTFPPGTIIGGITYPHAQVIGGVLYPSATIIGGVAYPTGEVIGGVVYPDGVVIGGVSYPPGTVVGGVAFPPGTVTSDFTYGTGLIFGGIAYPPAVVGGIISYPSSWLTGVSLYPTGSISGTISFPAGTIIGGALYPAGTITGETYFPTGTITGGTPYPGGVVLGAVTYPAGTVVGGDLTYGESTVGVTLVYNDAP